ncbi:tyrosine-protein phosphatase [Flavobacterium sp. ST-87]|uniref:Tyrosine-protein phosphatase n=1 Tax=Flavobacterium plantiphilum TaxID=3163297 RepID=A0ABW8XQW5_9FLAO
MKKNLFYVPLLAMFSGLQLSAQQKVFFQDSPNFRNFSEIVNAEGKKIKTNIYRSGSFSNLNEDEKKQFKNLHITTIVDFRNDFEITREPDYVPAESHIEVKNAPIGDIGSKSMQGFMKALAKPDFGAQQADSLMVDANKSFVANIADFKPFFESLKDDKSVVLFHCSAGKDRTGFAASMFLHILDVPKDEIMNDYLKSNEAVQYVDDKKLAMYGIPAEKMKLLMGVKASYLEAAWNDVAAKYGSVDNMLLKEFGIDASTKQLIKNKYLIN